MLIDEFPRLGKLPFFTDALAYLAGYHIKVMLVMQSKAQLDAPDAHGVGNTLIESCKVRCVFTPQDPRRRSGFPMRWDLRPKSISSRLTWGIGWRPGSAT
jgi:hypothetical protein